MSKNERIDFYIEAMDVLLEISGCAEKPCKQPDVHVLEWGESIAERVEEQTIQRCYRILTHEKGGIDRLYAQPEVKGAQNVEGE